MAKVKNEQIDSDFDLDADLDFDGLSFDMPEPKDDRHPAVRAAEGAIHGLAEPLKDTEFVKQRMKDVLPEGYGKAMDLGDKVTQNARALYDDSVKEILPVFKEFKRVAGKVAPKDSALIPKSVQAMLQRWREDSEYGAGASTPSKEALREQGIQSQLGAIFEAQVQQQAQTQKSDETNARIEQALDLKRHRDVFGVLNTVQLHVASLDNYQTRVTLGYQKKHLELQMRQLFVLQDVVREVQLSHATLQKELPHIVKNTGLPDAVKLQAKEHAGLIFQGKLFESVQRGLFSDRDSYLEKIFGNLKSNLKQKVSGAASAFSMGLQGVEQAHDMAQSMEGMGPGLDAAKEGGKIVGDYAGRWGLEQAGAKWGGSMRNWLLGFQPVAKGHHWLMDQTTNVDQRLNEFRKDSSTLVQDGPKGFMLRMLQSLMPGVSSEVDNDLGKRGGFGDLDQPYVVTRRADRSWNEVIPGFLARILQSSERARLKRDDVELVHYDWGSGKFMGEGKLKMLTLERALPQDARKRKQRELDTLLAQVDPQGQMDAPAREALKRHLVDNSIALNYGGEQRLASAQAYSHLDPKLAQQILPLMQAFMAQHGEGSAERLKFQQGYNGLKSSIADPRQLLQQMRASGQAEIAQQLGLLDRDERFDQKSFLDRFLATPAPVQVGLGSVAGLQRQMPHFDKGGDHAGGARLVGEKGPELEVTGESRIHSTDETVKIFERANRWDEKKAYFDARFQEIVAALKEGTRINLGNLEALQAGFATLSGGVMTMGQGLQGKARKGWGIFKRKVEDQGWDAQLRQGLAQAQAYQDQLRTHAKGLGERARDGLNQAQEKMRPYFGPGLAGSLSALVYDLTNASQRGARTLAKKGRELNNLAWDKGTQLVGFGKDKFKQGKKLAQTYWDDDAYDTYVEGEKTPRLTARGFKAGQYFDFRTRQPLKYPKEIKGAVCDAEGKILLEDKEVDYLFIYSPRDRSRKALKLAGKKALDFMNWMKVAGPANFMKQWGTFKDALKGGLGLSKKAYDFFDPPIDIYVKGEAQPALLARIMRAGGYVSAMTGKPVLRPSQIDGPVKDAQGNLVLSLDQLKAGITDAWGKEVKTPAQRLLGWLGKNVFGAVGRVLGAGRDLLSRGGKGIKRFLSNFSLEFTSGRQLTVLEEIRDLLKGAFQKKKRVVGDADGDGVRENSWQDLKRKAGDKLRSAKERLTPGKDKDKKKDDGPGMFAQIGALFSGLTGALGTFTNMLGQGFKLGGRLGGFLGKAVLGLGSLGGSAVLGAGKLLLGTGGTVARLGLGALSLGGSGLAAAATAAGSAALTIGGGVLSFLASPVVLGAAAIALTGYGGYKAYQYLKNRRAGPLTQLRAVQYGIPEGVKDHYAALRQSEDFLKEYVRKGDQGPVLNERDLDLKKLLGFWDVDPSDETQLHQFFKWYQRRFKPVYLTHVAAAQAVTKSSDLGAVDDLKDAALLQYFDAVKFPEGPYDVTDLPWVKPPFAATGAADVTALVKRLEAAWAPLRQKLKGQGAADAAPLTEPSAPAASPSAATLIAPAAGTLGAVDSVTSARFMQRPDDPFVASKAWSVLGPAGVTVVSGLAGAQVLLGNQLNALEALRYRAYGLKQLDRAKVRALKALEQRVSQELRFDSQNKASWSGNATALLQEHMGAFGIVQPLSRDGALWKQWFEQRFLPVYLVYISLYKHLTGRYDSEAGPELLKPEQRLEVARAVAGVAGIWSVSASPWPGEVLNTDASSIKENLEFLDAAAKKTQLDEQRKAAAPPPTTPSTPDPKQPPLQVPKYDTKPDPGPDGEPKPEATSSVTPAVGDYQPQGLKLASGEVVDGRNAKTFLNFTKGATLAGMNPALVKNFYGLVEEYGNLTGKKVNVNDGFRSYEQQAQMQAKYPGKAAAPGSSMHEYGLALDIDSATLDQMESLGLMRKYGFTRPVGGEPWHMEPAGIQMDISKYKRDQVGATRLIEDSLGRGGGGLGTIPGAPLRTRNTALATKLLTATASEVKAQKGSDGAVSISAKPALQTPAAAVGAPAAADGSPKLEAQARGLKVPNTPGGSFVSPDAETAPRSSPGGTGSASIPGRSASVQASVPADPNVKVPDAQNASEAKTTIESAAKMVGIDPTLALSVAASESGFNPNAKAKSSSASGLFQFVDNTWQAVVRKYGKQYGFVAGQTSPFDARANAIMGSHFIKDSIDYLKRRYSGTVGAAEAYMAHFLGPGGAVNFLNAKQANPDLAGAQIMPKAASANPTIFYDNGRPRSLSEIYALMAKKITTKLASFGIAAPPPSTEVKGPGPRAGAAPDLLSAGGADAAPALAAPKPQPAAAALAPPPQPRTVAPPAAPPPKLSSYVAPAPAAEAPAAELRSTQQALRTAQQGAATNPLTQAYGLQPPAPAARASAQLNAPGVNLSATENVLDKQLTVQTESRDTLKLMAETLEKMYKQAKEALEKKPDAPAPEAPAAQRPQAPARSPYTPPAAVVPMRKGIVS